VPEWSTLCEVVPECAVLAVSQIGRYCSLPPVCCVVRVSTIFESSMHPMSVEEMNVKGGEGTAMIAKSLC
jgi:hypothetical protein